MIEYSKLNFCMDRILKILNNAQNILVTSHLQPDPDALCSALGMYDYVLKTYSNVKVDIYFTGEKLVAYSALKNYDDIKWVNDVADVVNKYDTLIFTDGSQLSRFTNKSIDLTKFKTICIDHHKNEPSTFNATIFETNEPSASQIIYNHFFRSNKNLLDPYIAEVLLTGILSDTGMLKYVQTNALHTFDFVKELIEVSDTDLKTIEDKYFAITSTDWDIINALIQNIQKVDLAENSFIYSFLPWEYLQKYSENIIKQGKSKFQVMFATSIDKYKWSFIASPGTNKIVNLSFRSAPNSINVRKLAECFNGGGHDLASGGEVTSNGEPIQEISLNIVNKIKTLI
jgi:bifunctional oligoribonuclease and PAP phosphatase NrnA